MLNKQQIKEKLEQERDVLLEELKDIGKLNPETGEWKAVPMELTFPEADQSDVADRSEDFEARSSMVETFESRLRDVLEALKRLNKVSFGKCEVCKKKIESARLEANPASLTCKEHLEN